MRSSKLTVGVTGKPRVTIMKTGEGPVKGPKITPKKKKRKK